MADNMEWHTAAKQYLERLGRAEWIQQGKPMGGKGRYARRYCPSDYHRQLIECLNRNDEMGFKSLKMETGYASAIGV